VYARLKDAISDETALTRQELKNQLHEAAEGSMQRSSMADFVRSYSLLEITHPLVEMGKILGREHAAMLDRTFATIQRVYAPSSKRTFAQLRGEIQRFQGYSRLLTDLKRPVLRTNPQLVKALREYLQEEHDYHLPPEDIVEHLDEVLQNPITKSQLYEYLEREVTTLKPLFGFRDVNVGVVVKADDPKGLVSSREAIEKLDLLHLLRFFTWELNQTEPESNNDALHVVLTAICEPPLKVLWHLSFPGNYARFCKTHVGKPTALKGLTFESTQAGTTIPLPPTVAQVIRKQYVPGLVLEDNNLKPWQWGNVLRDGIYFCDLVVTFGDSGSGSLLEKTFRFFTGLDGYRIMARFGWSIERQTGEWWIA
jgi:hypothetical protein